MSQKRMWKEIGNSILDIGGIISGEVTSSELGRKAILNQAKTIHSSGVRGKKVIDQAFDKVSSSVATGTMLGAGITGTFGAIGGMANSDNIGDGVVHGIGGAGLGTVAGAGAGAIAAAIAKSIR